MSAPDTTAERVLQALRGWLKLAAARTPLTDAQVIPSDAPGPRPAKPYLTVKITSPDLGVGSDEDLAYLGDLVTVAPADEGTVYAITVRGEEVSYTAQAGDGAEEVAAALAAALCELELVYALATGDTIQIAALAGELGTETDDPNLELGVASQPVAGVGAQRRATVSLQGFGAETAGWLERAVLRLRAPHVRALLDAAGLTVIAPGSITNLALILDTASEPRYARDVEVSYALRSDPWFEVPAALVSAAVLLEDRQEDPDPYEIEITAELD